MSIKYRGFILSLLFFWVQITGWTQSKILGIGDFQEPLGAWGEAESAVLNPDDEKKLKGMQGKGIFISENGKTSNLLTKQTHGDILLELDFMISKGSNSGVYLQGRYEIQILDSWGKPNPGSGDCGGVYARYDGKKTFEGVPPLINAAKKPGEWQHLSIDFRAPRFNAKGEKIKNAVFRKVKLNGMMVQKKTEVTGPTASSYDNIEAPQGRLMLQGDHGPVAYRAIKMKHR